MKKIIICVLLAMTLMSSLMAKDGRSADAYFNVGFLGAFDAAIPLPQFGLNADWNITQNLMISPEIGVLFYLYIPVYITPGIQLNYKVNQSVYVGGGVTWLTEIYDSYDNESTLCLKLNAGWIKKRIKYNLYILLPRLHYHEYGTPLIIGGSVSFRF